MAKSSEWQQLYYAVMEVADRRGEALSRVWMVIESSVTDSGLANELRLAIIGDFLKDPMSICEVEEEDV